MSYAVGSPPYLIETLSGKVGELTPALEKADTIYYGAGIIIKILYMAGLSVQEIEEIDFYKVFSKNVKLRKDKEKSKTGNKLVKRYLATMYTTKCDTSKFAKLVIDEINKKIENKKEYITRKTPIKDIPFWRKISGLSSSLLNDKEYIYTISPNDTYTIENVIKTAMSMNPWSAPASLSGKSKGSAADESYDHLMTYPMYVRFPDRIVITAEAPDMIEELGAISFKRFMHKITSCLHYIRRLLMPLDPGTHRTKIVFSPSVRDDELNIDMMKK